MYIRFDDYLGNYVICLVSFFYLLCAGGSTKISSDPITTPLPDEDDKDEEDDDDDDDPDDECTEDEEDCVEGSGSEEKDANNLSSSTSSSLSFHQTSTENRIISPLLYTSTQHPVYHYHQPTPFTPPAHYWPRPTEGQFSVETTNKYENKFINEITVPPWTDPPPRSPRPVSPRPPPPRPTHIRIVDVPKPPERNIVTSDKEKPKKLPTKPLNRADNSADNMAAFIGLAAILLILIVIATPSILFLRRKYQPVNNYKCDGITNSTKSLRFLPVSPTPQALLSASHQAHLNSAINDSNSDKSVKGCKKKDLKEWYV